MTGVMLAATLAVAHAGGIHTGIPIRGVDGLGPVAFQTSSTGWTAPIEGGFIRAFIAPTEAEASAWLTRLRESLAKYKPEPNMSFLELTVADEAYGDGDGLLMFRDGNVGVMVRTKAEAAMWAEILLTAIVDVSVPWPKPPSLIEHDGAWTVDAPPDTPHIAFEGGRLLRHQGLRFSEPPHALVLWDDWGRAARIEIVDPQAPIAP